MKKLLLFLCLCTAFIACTKWETTNIPIQTVTNLTIKGDSNIFHIGDTNTFVINNPVTVNEGNTTVNSNVNVTPPNINMTYSPIDSSHTLINVAVGGTTVQEGNISLIANNSNSNVVTDTTSITNNNTNTANNSNTNQNNNNNTLSNVLSSAVKVEGDSIVINDSFVQQVSCPYTRDKCIIKCCKIHKHC